MKKKTSATKRRYGFTGFTVISLLLAFSCSGTQKPQAFKASCIEGDCENGTGTYVYSTGDKYTGQWVKGSRKGRGVHYFPNGDRFEGEFSQNAPCGKGIYTYADGTVEQGDFDKCLFAGVILLPVNTDESKKHIGRVHRTKPGRNEIEVAVSQSEGAKVLHMGQKVFLEVKGVMAAMEVTFPMVSVARCKMIGQTQMHINNVEKGMAVYEMTGGFVRGNNTFLFPNGNKYVGEHSGKLMQGKGEFFWTNGNRYAGEFQNGMRHGKGTLFWQNGDCYSGDWKYGKPEGTGSFSWPQGSRYEGQFLNGKKHGRGVYYFANGGRYEGEFRNDSIEGFGVKYSAAGEVMQKGRWTSGRYVGP